MVFIYNSELYNEAVLVINLSSSCPIHHFFHEQYIDEDDHNHTGKCIRPFGGIYAYCRYFIDRKW